MQSPWHLVPWLEKQLAIVKALVILGPHQQICSCTTACQLWSLTPGPGLSPPPHPHPQQAKTTEGDGKSKAEVTTEKYGLEAGLYQVR